MDSNTVFYDMVAEELSSGALIRGVYTKAFAEADGNADKAKAIYIKLRVRQLQDEYLDRLERAKADLKPPLTPQLETSEGYQASEKARVIDQELAQAKKAGCYAVFFLIVFTLAMMFIAASCEQA